MGQDSYKPATARRVGNADGRQTGKPARAQGPGSEANGDMDPAERRLLATMPLHAITAIHGEAGLRERFAIETASFPAAQRELIEQALELAARLHADDRRQREPYANHLLRVATRIISHYGVSDPDVICAALLHDTVEDHAGDLAPGGGQQALAVLAAQFGNRVAELVPRSPTHSTSLGATGTRSTASMSPPALKPVPGRGSSKPPTSPITAPA